MSETDACQCGCCEELAAMVRHPDNDFDYRRACHCAAYEVDEQCDCHFCASVLAQKETRK